MRSVRVSAPRFSSSPLGQPPSLGGPLDGALVTAKAIYASSADLTVSMFLRAYQVWTVRLRGCGLGFEPEFLAWALALTRAGRVRVYFGRYRTATYI